MRINDCQCKPPCETVVACSAGWSSFQLYFYLSAITASGTVCGSAAYNQYYVKFRQSTRSLANPPQITMGMVEYDPRIGAWVGEMDNVPGEPAYAYHWKMMFWPKNAFRNLASTSAVLFCASTWVEDDDGNILTDYLPLSNDGAFTGGYRPPVSCYKEHDPCETDGPNFDNRTYLPKFFFGMPTRYKVTVSGLSNVDEGDLSGEYILDYGVLKTGGGSCGAGETHFFHSSEWTSDAYYNPLSPSGLTTIYCLDNWLGYLCHGLAVQDCADVSQNRLVGWLTGVTFTGSWYMFLRMYYAAPAVGGSFYSHYMGMSLNSFDPYGANTLNFGSAPSGWTFPASLQLDFESFA